MSVTLIAEKAGVSIATVSRVLNNSRPVNPQIAENVRRAAEELQLWPRQTRRRSKSRLNGPATVAIVSVGQAYRSWFEVPIIANVVAELTRAAQQVHMGLLMTEMPDPHTLSPVLTRPGIDGAFAFIGGSLATRDISALRKHIPVVRVMGGQLSPVEIDHIGPDNSAVGFMAGTHLMSLGLRRWACFTTVPHWDFIRLRTHGFLAAAENAGIAVDMYVGADLGANLQTCGLNPIADSNLANIARRIATSRTGPLGLFVTRDEEAVQIHRHLVDAGIEIGKDVIIISCDNEAVRLVNLHPRPVSIDLNVAEIARQAVKAMIARIENPHSSATRVLVSPAFAPDLRSREL